MENMTGGKKEQGAGIVPLFVGSSGWDIPLGGMKTEIGVDERVTAWLMIVRRGGGGSEDEQERRKVI